MNHVVTKTFRDQNGEHIQGEMLDVSGNRATKLISLGYVRAVKEAAKQPVKENSDEVAKQKQKFYNSIIEKDKQIEALSDKFTNLDDLFNRLDTKYAEQSKELESVKSSLDGFVTSVKSAKVIAEVKVLVDAFEKIEAAK